MAEIKTHKDLLVWKKSIDLVEQIYKFTKQFPKEELYGITNQMRRVLFLSLPILQKGLGERIRLNLYSFCTSHSARQANLKLI